MKIPAPLFPLLVLTAAVDAATPEAKFRAVTIDAELGIGYGVAISDVDGDGKPDIVLADAKTTAWYRNPGWEKHRLTGNLTEKDHVCIAARDIDADGKAEIAVGGEWNPGDTVDSGAVFTLSPPADRTQLWTSAKLHREPTVHRMNWVSEADGRKFLAVLPLHGLNNRNGEGEGIRFLGYRPSKESDWPTFLLHQGFHMAHNFLPVRWNAGDKGESLLVAEKEGVHLLFQAGEKWTGTRLTDHGSGEVGLGKLPDGGRFIATADGGNWQLHATIDDNTMACEDLKSADLNNDGKPDLIAAGRATKNLVIYWNETGKP